MLADEDRERLREIAWQAFRAALGRGGPEAERPRTGPLAERGSAFVTLRKGGRLRGCIGLIGGRYPLAEAVRDAARRVLRDPRFAPVRPEELPELELEITVLSPFRRVEDPSEVEVGRHGLYISRGLASGLLLPQVAAEQGWDREEFLRGVCRKAGLPPDAWKSGDVDLQVFEGEVF